MTVAEVCEKFQTNINTESPYASPVFVIICLHKFNFKGTYD